MPQPRKGMVGSANAHRVTDSVNFVAIVPVEGVVVIGEGCVAEVYPAIVGVVA